MRLTSAKVETSGAVGPEPMTSRGSPMTSESSSDSTRGGRGQARQLAALDARNVFADGVDVLDGSAAGQQQLGDRLLLFERDAFGGQRQQGGSAAGDQAEHQVARAGAARQFGDAFRAGHSAGVGHRMAAFVQLDAPQPGQVAVLDVDQAGA